MKKFFDTEEKVQKLALRVVRWVFWSILTFCVLMILAFCKRFCQLPFLIIVAIGISVLVNLAGSVLLHVKILPKLVPSYPCEGYEFNKSTDLLTTPKVVIATVVLGLTIACTVALNIFWPLGTVAKVLPKTVFYSGDRQRLLDEDFGTIAVSTAEVAYALLPDMPAEGGFLVCAKVDVYGPFDCSRDLEEVLVEQDQMDCVTRVADDYPMLNRLTKTKFYVQVNHYEDGDWLIVKRLACNQDYFVPADEHTLVAVLEMINSGKIAYEVHDISNMKMQDKFDTLNEATDRVLIWQRAGQSDASGTELVLD